MPLANATRSTQNETLQMKKDIKNRYMHVKSQEKMVSLIQKRQRAKVFS